MLEREPSYAVGGNAGWGNHNGERYGGLSQKNLKIELLYDPEIPLLGKYSNYNSKRYMHHMLIAALSQ